MHEGTGSLHGLPCASFPPIHTKMWRSSPLVINRQCPLEKKIERPPPWARCYLPPLNLAPFLRDRKGKSRPARSNPPESCDIPIRFSSWNAVGYSLCVPWPLVWDRLCCCCVDFLNICMFRTVLAKCLCTLVQTTSLLVRLSLLCRATCKGRLFQLPHCGAIWTHRDLVEK